MKKKHSKIFGKLDKLRVKKSYYTFTQEYPKYIEVEKTGRKINLKSMMWNKNSLFKSDRHVIPHIYVTTHYCLHNIFLITFLK